MGSRVLSEIRGAQAAHAATAASRVEALMGAAQDAYLRLVDGLLAAWTPEPHGAAILAVPVGGLCEYLRWLRWTCWNCAQLAPLAPDDEKTTARRLATTMLAYAGGRLVDDGLDGHLSFKGHVDTLVGRLRAARPERPAYEACAQSVFAGFMVSRFALARMRAEGDGALADRIDRILSRVTPAMLAECSLREPAGRATYFWIVRRKAAAFNAMLYRAVLGEARREEGVRLYRALHEIDELAQILNDLGDEAEDRASGRMNALGHGIYESESIDRVLAERVARIWRRAARLDAPARYAVARMLGNLDATLWRRLPAEAPGAAAAGRLDEAILAGVRHLEAAQRPSGEFPTYWSTSLDLADATYAESPFLTACVLLALRTLDPAGRHAIVQRAIPYLASKRREGGLVSFLEQGIDPDLDDVALVNWVLQQHRRHDFRYRALALWIAGLPLEGGHFPTWVRADPAAGNETDPCVTANVLRFLSQNVVRAEAPVAAVRAALRDPAQRDGTLFYVAPAALPYLVSSLCRRLRDAVMSPAERNAHARALLERCWREELGSVHDRALALTVCCAEGVPSACTRFLAEGLLDSQGANGAWPARAAFRAFNFWGSAELSTALAVEALWAYRSALG